MLHQYPDVISVSQLAQILGIGLNSAYRIINAQEIGSIRVGKKIIVPKICVEDYLNSARHSVHNDNNRPTVERSKS